MEPFKYDGLVADHSGFLTPYIGTALRPGCRRLAYYLLVQEQHRHLLLHRLDSTTLRLLLILFVIFHHAHLLTIPFRQKALQSQSQHADQVHRLFRLQLVHLP